jgi:UDP-N-acetylmuramate dehydrogenase
MTFPNGLKQITTEHELLATHTWFGIGGTARWMMRPQSSEQVTEVVRCCREEEIPLYKLGLGANLLVADEGVDGVVIRLNAPAFRKIYWEPDLQLDATGHHDRTADKVTVTAGGGVDMNRLVLDSVRRGLSGLQYLAGIPGTIGGALRMNAGGRWGQVADVVREVTVVDALGTLRTIPTQEIGFAYRHSNLQDMIICQAKMELTPDDPERIRQQFMDIWEHKKSTQPLAHASAGCIFKNPHGQSAGALIDQAGMKGSTVGGASVSKEHANFIIAKEGATAHDVCNLIGRIRRRVFEEFSVELETEIEIWGKCGVLVEG